MVDPIEVKLDEIEDRQIKTQKDLDILMRDWSKPQTKREILGGLPTGSTGFLDTIIKSVTGGKFGGAMMAGGVAGGVAGAVMILGGIIQDAIKQSKIVSTFTETVGKALGLLVDLILLPFLPLLVWAMVNLYSGIVGFGTWWKEVWETLKKEGLFGLIKLGLDFLYEHLPGWAKTLLKFVFGTAEERDHIIKMTLQAIWDWYDKWIAPIGEAILKFLFTGDTTDLKKIAKLYLDFALGIVDKIFDLTLLPILKLFFGEKGADAIEKSLKFLVHFVIGEIAELISSIIDPILKFVFGSTDLKLKTIQIAIDFVVGAGQWVLDMIVQMASLGMIKGLDWSKLSSPNTTSSGTGGGADWGGATAGRTGTSMSSGGNTFNFYGLTHEQLPDKVREILRQEGTRYTQ
jgi:hypothetical protein